VVLQSKLGNADDINEFGEKIYYKKKDKHIRSKDSQVKTQLVLRIFIYLG